MAPPNQFEIRNRSTTQLQLQTAQQVVWLFVALLRLLCNPKKEIPKGNDRTRQHKAQGEELEKRQGQRGQRDRETREKERTNKAKALLLATLVAAS